MIQFMTQGHALVVGYFRKGRLLTKTLFWDIMGEYSCITVRPQARPSCTFQMRTTSLRRVLRQARIRNCANCLLWSHDSLHQNWKFFLVNYICVFNKDSVLRDQWSSIRPAPWESPNRTLILLNVILEYLILLNFVVYLGTRIYLGTKFSMSGQDFKRPMYY
jgi:hypothetical protein